MAERKILGRFIVIDPTVRGGEPSFRGTRLTVREVVEQLADGRPWDALIARSEGTLSRRAISEALALCIEAFLAETERLRGCDDQTRLELGEPIVMDPLICHGKPTFTGSRVMVWQVLRSLEDEADREMIRSNWHGTVTDAAIAESLLLALRMFLDRATAFVVETVPACQRGPRLLSGRLASCTVLPCGSRRAQGSRGALRAPSLASSSV